VSLVPANPIKAAADGAMLPVIVFAVIFALALGRLTPPLRATAVTFFGALAEAMLVIVHWVLAVAPIGVFALTVPLALRVGASVVGAVAVFLLVHCGLLVVLGALFYLLAATLGRQPLGRFARAALPAQIVAVSTRSSVAALPAMIDGAERVLGIPPVIAGFGLPFAISMFRVNTPLSWIVSGLFVAELYGVPLGMSGVAIIGAGGVLMSLSVPGIPSGGLFILAPLFLAAGLPVEGIGILIALDAIPDMFKTTVIVTGDLAATALLARSPLPTTEAIAAAMSAPIADAEAVV
jgi:Na+/H+-dicarboxylate symporter